MKAMARYPNLARTEKPRETYVTNGTIARYLS